MFYTDPNSGLMIWQILVAGAVGAMLYIRKAVALIRRKSVHPSQEPQGQEISSTPE